MNVDKREFLTENFKDIDEYYGEFFVNEALKTTAKLFPSMVHIGLWSG